MNWYIVAFAAVLFGVLIGTMVAVVVAGWAS